MTYNGTELRLTYVLCSGTNVAYGEILDAKSRKLSRKRNLPATSEVVFDMDSPMAQNISHDAQVRLKIYRFRTVTERGVSNPNTVRQLIFYGVLPPENVKDDTATGEVTCTFADPRVRFAQYYLPAQTIFAATGQGTIIDNFLTSTQARTGGDVRLNSGVIDVSQLRDRTYEAGTNIAQAIADLTAVINGPDVDVIPTESGPTFMGTLNTYAHMGTDKSASIIFSHQQKGFTNCDIERTFSQAITLATETGTDPTGVVQTQTAGTPATSNYGLLESWAAESSAFDTATLLTKAQGIVDQYAAPQAQWAIKNVTREAPKAMIDYDLGDTIRLQVKRGARLNANVQLRVDGYELNVQNDGNCDVSSLLLVDP